MVIQSVNPSNAVGPRGLHNCEINTMYRERDADDVVVIIGDKQPVYDKKLNIWRNATLVFLYSGVVISPKGEDWSNVDMEMLPERYTLTIIQKQVKAKS
jgi:hypothetical protein